MQKFENYMGYLSLNLTKFIHSNSNLDKPSILFN